MHACLALDTPNRGESIRLPAPCEASHFLFADLLLQLYKFEQILSDFSHYFSSLTLPTALLLLSDGCFLKTCHSKRKIKINHKDNQLNALVPHSLNDRQNNTQHIARHSIIS